MFSVVDTLYGYFRLGTRTGCYDDSAMIELVGILVGNGRKVANGWNCEVSYIGLSIRSYVHLNPNKVLGGG